MFKQKIKTRMKTSCKCETILKGLEKTATIAGGVEEVVDRVEEEDEEPLGGVEDAEGQGAKENGGSLR